MEKIRSEEYELTDSVSTEVESSWGLFNPLDEELNLVKPLDNFNRRLIKIHPSNEKVQVVGVDVSSRKIGDSAQGVVCAVRGTVVWRDEYAYQYKRYGPFVFHIEYVDEVFGDNAYGKHFLNQNIETTNSSMLVNKVQALVEKELQKHVFNHSRNSITLLDGCLHNRNIESKTLSLARKNNNKILAVSKKSRIFICGRPVTSYLDGVASPSLLHITDLIQAEFDSNRMPNWVFVVKLAEGSLAFRMDADGWSTFEGVINTVQSLIGNDLVVQGYPETLRMAHMLSVFTPVEVVAVQRFLAQKHQLRVKKPENTRRILFGPYGRWTDS